MGRALQGFGALSFGVGLFGVALTVVGLVGLWRAAAGFTVRAVEVAEAAIAVSDNAESYVGRTAELMNNMQQKVSSLKQTADVVSADSQKNREVVPALQRLDEELVRELGEARSLLQSVQSGTDMLKQAVGLFDSFSSPVRMFRRPAEPRENSDLSELTASLTETSAQIQQVIDFVAKIEEQGISEAQAEEFKLAVGRLEASLKRGQARLEVLQTFLKNTRDNVRSTKQRLPVWTNAGAAFCTALFICFGFTQIQLVAFGRRLWSENAA